MSIQFTDLSKNDSPALKKLATEKLQRLYKLASGISNIHMTFEIEKLRHIAEAHVELHGLTFHAKSESEDMYKTIDLLVDKLASQLKKHKEKHSEHR